MTARRRGTETFTLLVAGVPGLRLADPVAVGTIVDND